MVSRSLSRAWRVWLRVCFSSSAPRAIRSSKARLPSSRARAKAPRPASQIWWADSAMARAADLLSCLLMAGSSAVGPEPRLARGARRKVPISVTLAAMNWHLQCPDRRTVPLAEDSDTLVGAAAHAQVRLATLPERCAVIQHLDGDVWLQVLAEDAHVGVNGRPVQRLSRLRAGDRICFGGTCIDLVRPERPGPAGRVADFFLRVRNGPRSGNVHRGPVLHLDEEGEVVSAAAGRVGLVLADGAVRLAPNGTRLRLNGVPVTGEVVAV